MNEALAARLESLKQRDIDTRERLLKQGKLYGNYDEEMQRVHTENAEVLDGIISDHGWPGISMVGLEGCRAAWLVAQHAICTPELQRRFLHQLEKAVEAGEAPAKQAALLTDRIRFNEDKPQVYGTVFDWNAQGELDCELEDPEHVDALRESVGLPPFQQSLLDQREAVKAEGGEAPVDFDACQEAAKRWARQVGWR